MNEGVALLVIFNMLAAGLISVSIVQKREAAIREHSDWKRLPGLIAGDLLFLGSFCVIFFYMHVENMINQSYVQIGCTLAVTALILAHLCFGVGRFWRLVIKKSRERRQEEPCGGKQEEQPGGKTEEEKSGPVGENSSGAGAYMQYALIYMAMGMVVIGMAEAFLCKVLEYISLNRPVQLFGIAVEWSDIQQQLLGTLLVCSLVGFLLSTIRVGQEYEQSRKWRRRDKIDDVKRYLRS